ncbi:MAG TPA: hypothetical protein VHL53_19970, partial [Acidimicrobiia bacterium]|nr:hypothetical protein [Acidimicrobiia bacterium]
ATVMLVLTFAGVACSSGGGDKDKEAKASTTAPEEHQAPAAEVTAGLTTINSTAAQIALATGADSRSAKELNDSIEPAWEKIEGTIRSNDADLYIRFEDDFAALGKAVSAGDSAKAQSTAADIADAVKAYQAKFPG